LPPITGAEDFSEFGRTVHRVPAVIWTVGAGDPAAIAAAKQAGKSVPTNHSPDARFLHDPTLQTCVTSLSAAALELMPAKSPGR
jgi:metal-dependent amidase/aminoacylase/carboxypeptidase family protein